MSDPFLMIFYRSLHLKKLSLGHLTFRHWHKQGEIHSLRTCLILASVATHYASDGLSNLYATVESKSNSENSKSLRLLLM